MEHIGAERVREILTELRDHIDDRLTKGLDGIDADDLDTASTPAWDALRQLQSWDNKERVNAG